MSSIYYTVETRCISMFTPSISKSKLLRKLVTSGSKLEVLVKIRILFADQNMPSNCKVINIANKAQFIFIINKFISEVQIELIWLSHF